MDATIEYQVFVIDHNNKHVVWRFDYYEQEKAEEQFKNCQADKNNILVQLQQSIVLNKIRR